MSVRVYVPGDSAACSVGADEVAARIVELAAAEGVTVEVIRNGSRGMLWLEPFVEVQTAAGRVGYGPVTAGDVEALIGSGLLEGRPHALGLGLVDQIPWLARQQRVSFARVGLADPLDLDEYRRLGGLVGLSRALATPAEEVADDILASGLRGRGGAGFPAGIKWRTVQEAVADQKYVCCNADEGDSGTFADRMLMEGDPFTLLEGMAIAGTTVGASLGLIYVRSEYPAAIRTLRTAVDIARVDGWLGPDVLGSGRAFDVRIVEGAGSYVCGEETAMLESLEGKRGMVRPKPPIPALQGLFGKPTLVHNVLTLSAVPADPGRRPGGLPGPRCGSFARNPGVPTRRKHRPRRDRRTRLRGEPARTCRRLRRWNIHGRPVRAVQVGGPLGAYLPDSALDVSMDYESLLAANSMLGHGGVVVFDDTVDMAAQARFAMEFCAVESCGKCTPCRIGSTRGVETIDKITAGIDPERNLELLEELCETMTDGSLCAMGGLTPLPVRSAVAHFGEDFHRSANGEGKK